MSAQPGSAETIGSPRRNFNENATARYRAKCARLFNGRNFDANSAEFLPPPSTDSPRANQDVIQAEEQTDANEDQQPEATFMFNGERVPISQLRSKMFQTSKTKRATPIPMRSGGFTFQK